MNFAKALWIISSATSLLTAGCDGGLHVEGVTKYGEGKPAPSTPVYLFTDGNPDKDDPIIRSDANGHFELNRLDCPCDFKVELVACSDLGIAKVSTSNKILRTNSHVVLSLSHAETSTDGMQQRAQLFCRTITSQSKTISGK